MKKGWLTIGITFAATILTLAGCSSSDKAEDNGKETITFINHKTDWETNGKWTEYIQEFNKKYPDIEVEVQTITDYAGQMKTRMNSQEYGDVLMIPGDISPSDYGTFFEPLGKKSELEETYLGLNDRSFKGVQYGIPSQMNASGMVVNMKVFEEAGIKEFPKTPEGFIKALQQIKEKNPDVIPLYTNYAAGWTLTNWDFVKAAVVGDKDFTAKMIYDKTPFDKEKSLYSIYNLLYSVAKEGLIEKDPTTSDWEQSKVDMANGKVAVMVLGSWAVPQIQEIVPENAENITFQAFPMTTSDGKQYMAVGGDYNYGINIHSKHKEAARKFIDWMVTESNYAKDNGGLPAIKGGEYPEALRASKYAGVILFEETPMPEEDGKETWYADILNLSELGIGTTDTEKQRIIDAAVGNSKESFDDIMRDFNNRWGKAVTEVTGQ